jgi:hypothetical protein
MNRIPTVSTSEQIRQFVTATIGHGKDDAGWLGWEPWQANDGPHQTDV